MQAAKDGQRGFQLTVQQALAARGIGLQAPWPNLAKNCTLHQNPNMQQLKAPAPPPSPKNLPAEAVH